VGVSTINQYALVNKTWHTNKSYISWKIYSRFKNVIIIKKYIIDLWHMLSHVCSHIKGRGAGKREIKKGWSLLKNKSGRPSRCSLHLTKLLPIRYLEWHTANKLDTMLRSQRTEVDTMSCPKGQMNNQPPTLHSDNSTSGPSRHNATTAEHWMSLVNIKSRLPHCSIYRPTVQTAGRLFKNIVSVTVSHSPTFPTNFKYVL